MELPKYVAELLNRSEYNFNTRYEVGYTIDIEKRSNRQLIGSHLKDIQRLKSFVEKNGGEMIIQNAPSKTRYAYQCITVTIYDPLMKYLEKHIKDSNKTK